MGQSSLVARAVEATGRLLDVARAASVPVIFCTTWFRPDRSDMPPWKISSMDRWIEGSWEAEVDERLWRDGDIYVVKKAPSIFFGTPVFSILTLARIDTVLMTGANTSGCIRASTIDSFSYGFKTIIPRECVGDQGQAPHDSNLLDIERRYADVISLEAAIQYLESTCVDSLAPTGRS